MHVILDDVWLRYQRGGPWVLQDVTAQISTGEIVVLQGRNGAGKSTLLQVIAGVLPPTKGRVTGRPRRIGWVPERFPADQPFTTESYLQFVADIRGGGEVDAWIERLGLSPFRTVKLPELSKGTAQKVGLAQALLVPPDLLILDEPWEGLDAATRSLVPEIVLEVTAAGGAVLVSDHRGETAWLPGATQWTLTDGALTTVSAASGALCVVEVVVPAHEVSAAVTQWRAEGRQILKVRAE